MQALKIRHSHLSASLPQKTEKSHFFGQQDEQIYARIRSARATINSDMERWELHRKNQVNNDVVLYWTSKLMTLELDLFWRRLELEELQERENCAIEVGNRFQDFLPTALLQGLMNQHQSVGALALTLTHEQSRNSDLIRQISQLESNNKSLKIELERIEVALNNVIAAGELVLFETYVVNNAHMYRDAEFLNQNNINNVGFTYLKNVNKIQNEIEKECSKIDNLLLRAKQKLGLAIDLFEIPARQKESMQLFQECGIEIHSLLERFGRVEQCQ